MKRIRSHYHILQVLRTACPKLRKVIILNCGKELVNCISEINLNVLNGNLKLSDRTKRKLKKYKTLLRKLADRHVSSSAKKRLINQRGGFLFPLLTAALPILANFLFRQRAN